MKLAVLGATGETGRALVAEALRKGHTIKTLLRDKKKLPSLTHPEDTGTIEAVEGGLHDEDAIEEVIRDADAVVICLGAGKNTPPVTVVQDGVRAVIQAMKKLNKRPRRLILLTSSNGDPPQKKNPLNFLWHQAQLFVLNNAFKDHEKAEQLCMAEGDWLQYTILRPQRLVPAESTGYTLYGPTPPFLSAPTTHADLAQAMLDLAERDDHIGERVGVTSTGSLPISSMATGSSRIVKLVWENVRDKILLAPKRLVSCAVHGCGKRGVALE